MFNTLSPRPREGFLYTCYVGGAPPKSNKVIYIVLKGLYLLCHGVDKVGVTRADGF